MHKFHFSSVEIFHCFRIADYYLEINEEKEKDMQSLIISNLDAWKLKKKSKVFEFRLHRKINDKFRICFHVAAIISHNISPKCLFMFEHHKHKHT
jgi:hypothetical protein